MGEGRAQRLGRSRKEKSPPHHKPRVGAPEIGDCKIKTRTLNGDPSATLRASACDTQCAKRIELDVVIALGEGFFDLGGELGGEGVETLSEVANVLEEIVVGDECGDGGKKSRGGGDEGFGDAGSDGAEAGGSGSAESGEGINDAPDGAEEADEGSNASGGGEPGHAFFDAADFFAGSELHADDDGLNAFDFSGERRWCWWE